MEIELQPLSTDAHSQRGDVVFGLSHRSEQAFDETGLETDHKGTGSRRPELKGQIGRMRKAMTRQNLEFNYWI